MEICKCIIYTSRIEMVTLSRLNTTGSSSSLHKRPEEANIINLHSIRVGKIEIGAFSFFFRNSYSLQLILICQSNHTIHRDARSKNVLLHYNIYLQTLGIIFFLTDLFAAMKDNCYMDLLEIYIRSLFHDNMNLMQNLSAYRK